MESEKVEMVNHHIIVAVSTLLFGVFIGYLGQRSGSCFISGTRDLYFIRNTYLFKAIIGALAGAFGGFVIFNGLGVDLKSTYPFLILLERPGLFSPLTVIFAVIGGLGIGFFSVLAEGCPFRNHVRATEGRGDAIFYLLGFYIGIVYFYLVTKVLVTLIVTAFA